MAIDRSTILRGPAVITFGGATLYSKSDIELELAIDTFEVTTSIYGRVDERVTDRVTKITFTPDGQWESISVLWPYATMALGDSVFTGTDRPLVIKTKEGKTLTFAAAALTKMPSLTLGATRTSMGALEFTCIGANNDDWTTASNLVAVASAAFSDATFDPSAIITEPMSAAWGASSPWNAFKTSDGWTIDFDLRLSPVVVDDEGLVDMTFDSLVVTAKATPLGITEANVITALKLQGAGATRGRSLQTGASDLVLTGASGRVIYVRNAQLTKGPLKFGSGALRVGELTWQATRKFTAGVAAPLFQIS